MSPVLTWELLRLHLIKNENLEMDVSKCDDYDITTDCVGISYSISLYLWLLTDCCIIDKCDFVKYYNISLYP